MRLKVDLSLPNSQHFTIWNKITQGSSSAHSMLHASPRWKASGWNDLQVQRDCISQVRGCWRWASALSQHSVAWYRLCWKWCRASLPQQEPWEAFWLRKLSWHLLPLQLFPQFHKRCSCLLLGEPSLGCPEWQACGFVQHLQGSCKMDMGREGKNGCVYVLVPNMCIKAPNVTN